MAALKAAMERLSARQRDGIGYYIAADRISTK